MSRSFCMVAVALLLAGLLAVAPQEADAQKAGGICMEQYGETCNTLVDICTCYDHFTGTYWCDYLDCWDADDDYCSLAICGQIAP